MTMSDFSSRQVIEALRSGVPSRAVGAYFSEARPQMMKRLTGRMDQLQTDGSSGGMIFTGRYGEGKTHLLNTAFSMAAEKNMAVSYVALGKETPIDKPDQLYRKVMAQTYLPGAKQPGFRARLEESLTPGSNVTGELLAYTARELQTDRIYYLLKALIGAQEEDDREVLLADLEGDFTTDGIIKKTYRRVTGTPAKFSQTFSKTKHAMDYFCFMSHLFRSFGLDGWVLLFDEAELMGRYSKKGRAKAYVSMQKFLRPDTGLEQSLSIFAFSSSYAEDVIDRKHEFDVVKSVWSDDPDALKASNASLNAILAAPELAPLTKEEIRRILVSIQEFHGKAYDWTPSVSEETLLKASENGGYLLRTKIRAAIEFLDQLYQYGEVGETKITDLGKECLDDDETEIPELDELDIL